MLLKGIPRLISLKNPDLVLGIQALDNQESISTLLMIIDIFRQLGQLFKDNRSRGGRFGADASTVENPSLFAVAREAEKARLTVSY
jgi:hypothetical protein